MTSTPSLTRPDRHPNPRGEGGRLRGEILAAAAQLLEATGNEHAVTLRAVARQAGITAPAIYRHFPDRQTIMLTLAQDAFGDLADHLHAATAATAEPADRLRATCEAYLAYAAHQPQRYRLMFGGLWDGAEAVSRSAVTAAEVTTLGQEALNVLTNRLQACVDDHTSTSTNAEADAVALWLGLHGLAHQRTVIPAYPWPHDIADRVVGSLARLRPPATSSDAESAEQQDG